jgi:hypothetical protein
MTIKHFPWQRSHENQRILEMFCKIFPLKFGNPMKKERLEMKKLTRYFNLIKAKPKLSFK